MSGCRVDQQQPALLEAIGPDRNDASGRRRRDRVLGRARWLASGPCADRRGTVRNSVREAGSSLIEEPFAEDDGELRFGLDPLARGTFLFLSGVVQHQI